MLIDYIKGVILLTMIHIVEDEPFLRDILADILKEHSRDVQDFGCPYEYLKHMRSPDYKAPIAIFSDVKMPHMSGYDFMNQVRQVNPNQRFVIICGKNDIEQRKENLLCSYLCTPFSSEKIKNIVAGLLECHRECKIAEIGCLKFDHRCPFNIRSPECPDTP